MLLKKGERQFKNYKNDPGCYKTSHSQHEKNSIGKPTNRRRFITIFNSTLTIINVSQ